MLGWLDPDAMKAAMPQRVYSGWQAYWNEEPWGAWRDNLHAAMLAREVAKTVPGRKRVPELSVFFYQNPFARRQESNMAAVLGVVATRVTAEEASARLKATRAKRQRSKRGKG